MINFKMILNFFSNDFFDDISLNVVFLITLIDWYVDFECTKHMTSNKNDFVEYHLFTSFYEVYVVNDVVISTIEKKTVKLKIIFLNEIVNDVTFKKVLHVFKLTSTLLSISQIIKNENFVIFDEKKCFIKNKTSKCTILHAFNCRNQYSIDLMKSKTHIVNLIVVFYSNSKYNEKTVQL